MKTEKYEYKIPTKIILDFLEYIKFYQNIINGRIPKIQHGQAIYLYLRQNLIVIENYLETSLYIAINKDDVCQQKLDYQLVIPLLARVIADILCNTIYILHDSPNRMKWYAISGMVDLRTDIIRDIEVYKNTQPDRVKRRIFGYKKIMRRMELKIKDLKTKIEYFPTPPQMRNKDRLKNHPLSTDKIWILDFVIKHYFHRLSEFSHQSFNGLILSSARKLYEIERMDNKHLPTYANEYIIDIITLAMATLTEIEIGCNYSQKERMNYFWTIISNLDALSLKLYEERYKGIIS